MTTTPNSTTIPKTSGIYKIDCTANKKVYIGSAVDLNSRWRTHISRLRRGVHMNRHLQSAFKKYGESAFVFEVIELVLVSFLLEREQYWLDKLKAHNPKHGFNIRIDARSNLGLKPSKETRAKMSVAGKAVPRTPEWRANQSAALKGRSKRAESVEKMRWTKTGKKQSPEHIENSRKARIGLKRSAEFCAMTSERQIGRVFSEEHRQKISEASKRQEKHRHTPDTILKIHERKRAVAEHRPICRAFAPDGSVYEVFKLRPFCLEYKLDRRSVQRALETGKVYAKWRFECNWEGHG